MASHVRVAHSILSTGSLVTQVLSNYPIGTIQDCQFISIGCNDTYLIRSDDGERFVLRVYRAGWRSIPDIQYEIDILLHLKRKGIAVSYPLPQIDGSYLHAITAPEGLRHAVLFSYAPGTWLDLSLSDGREIGHYAKAIARLHLALDDFASTHSRFELDLDYLLSNSMASLRPYMNHRPVDWAYLQQMANRIQIQFHQLPVADLERGHCHGDLHGGNAFISPDHTVTFFDFDCAGFGWRAYELAVFRWSARRNGTERQWWDPFIRSYQTERLINEADLNAIPLFVGIRHFWLLGLHSSNSGDWGFAISDEYLNEHVKFFKDWEADYFA